MDKKNIFSAATKLILSNKLTRNFAIKQLDKILYKKIVDEGHEYFSKRARLDRYNGMKAMYTYALKNLDKGFISKEVMKRGINTLINGAFLDGNKRKETMEEFKRKYGIKPPSFIVISPTKTCNLKCEGCYASSDYENITIEWNLLDKIMTEAHDEMGMRFFVISGGEPLMYKSEGKTILDLPRKWKDSFFLMYTNGLLITEEMAKEMAELGNITPAISVEGFEKETDERRGKGVYQKILKAFENLKREQVIFGTSVTVTRKNIDILLKDDVYDFYFDKMGSTYMWMFQYMPIGRKFTTKLMIIPEQRFELFKKWNQQLSQNHRFIADFWNSAILSSGCISCGKSYFYIDWNANIVPCAFIPYYKDNIRDLYIKGKKLRDALFSKFFVKGREWQDKYLNEKGKTGNLMMPCLIRDHHKEFLKLKEGCNLLPEDEAAAEAMKDQGYHKELIKFDKKLKEITEPYWNEVYAKKE